MFTQFSNAHIYTLDPNNPRCNTLIVKNDRIVFCGNQSEINLPESKTRIFDLKGLSVLPAFTDCHTHFVMSSKKIDLIKLDSNVGFQETIESIKDGIKNVRKGDWVKGGGWNSNLWNGLVPNKHHLDQISDDHPIALFNQDLHTMWLNSLALKNSGFLDPLPASVKEKVKLGGDNQPTGLIYEDACKIVEERSNLNLNKNLDINIYKMSNELLKYGITSAHTMENMNDLDLLMKIHRNNGLKTRICFHPPQEEMDDIISAKIYSGFGNSWLRFGGLKYYVDGSLGSQTAEMFENFNCLDHAGIEMITEKDLSQKIKYAAQNGLSATVHAIGDKANYKTLNGIESANNQITSPFPLRHRIEHCQILTETDLNRVGQLNCIASMQPLHISFDVKIADKYLGHRAKYAFAINSLMKSGAKVVFSSDMPVADFNPFKTMHAAISRRYNLDPSESSWYPKENINLNEALNAYTKDAAYSSYEENIKGTLQAGKLADFVILSEDLIKSRDVEESLQRVEVLATVMNGNVVYKNENFDI